MTLPEVEVQDDGAVRILRLRRPAARNALSLGLMRTLRDELGRASAEPSVRAVVLTGDSGAFCAGLDLAELRDIPHRTAAQHRADTEVFRALLDTLYTLPKPTVAAVNGAAVGGGAGLVAACDLAVMDEGARLGFPEVQLGFVAALVGVFLVRQVGEKRARDLLLSGRLVSSAEAERLGLVNAVVPSGTALQAALERAHALTHGAPEGLALTKAVLAAAPGQGWSEGLRLAAEANALARAGAELREGVAARFEGRPPAWVMALVPQDGESISNEHI